MITPSAIIAATAASLVLLVVVLVFRAVVAGFPNSQRPLRSAHAARLVDVFSKRKHITARRLATAIRLRTISYDPPGDGSASRTSKACCGDNLEKPVNGTPAHAHESAYEEAVRASSQELLRLHELLAKEYPLIHVSTVALCVVPCELSIV
jgi:hypothetical protein